MTEHSPITPPPELVRQWQAEKYDCCKLNPRCLDLRAYSQAIANRAAQWGYLQHEKALLDAMHATELPPS